MASARVKARVARCDGWRQFVSPAPKVDAKGNNGKVCLNQIREVENMDVGYKVAYISISASASDETKEKLT